MDGLSTNSIDVVRHRAFVETTMEQDVTCNANEPNGHDKSNAELTSDKGNVDSTKSFLVALLQTPNSDSPSQQTAAEEFMARRGFTGSVPELSSFAVVSVVHSGQQSQRQFSRGNAILNRCKIKQAYISWMVPSKVSHSISK